MRIGGGQRGRGDGGGVEGQGDRRGSEGQRGMGGTPTLFNYTVFVACCF